MQGFGNAGAAIAERLAEAGMKVVAVSDSSTALHAPEGLDIGPIAERKRESGELEGEALEGEVSEIDGEELLALEVDLLIPSALEGAINADNVGDVKAKAIFEVANGPVSPDADSRAARARRRRSPPTSSSTPAGSPSPTTSGCRTAPASTGRPTRCAIAFAAGCAARPTRSGRSPRTSRCHLRVAAYVHALRRLGEASDARGSAERYQAAPDA